ncbi:MAG TPA: sulfite exporter TauE/SafE family protein [Longimicrobiales bacterium]
MTALGIGALALAGVVAAGIAAVSGFGIGSLLTPLLALEVGTKLAVAAVAVPHAVATAQRFWMLRRYVDRRVLLGFGLASAAGGLAGALAHVRVSSRALAVVFGVVVALAGVSEFTGWMRRVRWGRRSAWIAGASSGVLGGMVGNQGGIRTAALLGFDVPKESFVATSTAIGLFVDAARLPVYLATQWRDILAIWPLVVVATAAVVVGTVLGTRVLGRVPQRLFRRLIAALLIGLGLYMVAAGPG